MLRTFAAITALIALSACASTATSGEAAPARDCFRAVDVNGFGIADEHRVRITVGANRHYLLTILQSTRNIDWTQSLTLRSGTSFVCTGNTRGVVELYGGQLPMTYPVQSIEREPEAEPAPQGS